MGQQTRLKLFHGCKLLWQTRLANSSGSVRQTRLAAPMFSPSLVEVSVTQCDHTRSNNVVYRDPLRAAIWHDLRRQVLSRDTFYASMLHISLHVAQYFKARIQLPCRS